MVRLDNTQVAYNGSLSIMAMAIPFTFYLHPLPIILHTSTSSRIPHTSPFTPHPSSLTPHPSPVTPPLTSQLTPHLLPHPSPLTSHLNPNPYVRSMAVTSKKHVFEWQVARDHDILSGHEDDERGNFESHSVCETLFQLISRWAHKSVLKELSLLYSIMHCLEYHW